MHTKMRIAPFLLTEPSASDDTASTLTAAGLSVLAGRYLLVRRLGSGATGYVYEAEDLELKTRLGLKLMRPEIADEPRTVERFKREVLMARRITDPNVCRIYDFGADVDASGQRAPFFTMELLRGGTLSSVLKRRRMRVH